jgi:uncharacterized protein (TIGR02996 family)
MRQPHDFHRAVAARARYGCDREQLKCGGMRLAAVLLTVLLLFSISSMAQDADVQAQRLQDAGDFAGAVKLLKLQLAEHPDDGDGARMLAQTLYWMKDLVGARSTYESALAKHPEDSTLRLQYAQMLAETGQRAKAREMVKPLLNDTSKRAQAEALLGKLAFWDGDLRNARRQFVEALQDNQTQEEVRRQLDEIDLSTAPWVRISSGGWHDDQPLDRGSVTLEAGWFPTTLTQISTRIQPMRYSIDAGMRTIGTGEVVVQQYLPQWHMETELAGGAVGYLHSDGSTWELTQRTAIGFRLPQHVTIRGRFERAPYLYTVTSLYAPIMVLSGTGLVHWESPRGWLGEAGFRHERYPDNNAVRTAYGWLLAPLVHQKPIEIQAGYAINASNADESRFVLDQPTQPYAPTDPRFDFSGHYAPYYTANHLVTHSATAALTARSQQVTFRLSGSYGLYATDDAPIYGLSAGQALLGTHSRKFHPWNIHSSFEIKSHNGFSVEPMVEAGRTVFYSWLAGGLQVTYSSRTFRRSSY